MLETVRAISLAAMSAALLLAAAQTVIAQQSTGGITRSDFDAVHADFFFGADVDFDLALTQAEIDAQLRRSSDEVRSIVAIASYDADGDGKVTYDEFTAGAAAEFHRRDVNGDDDRNRRTKEDPRGLLGGNSLWLSWPVRCDRA